MMELLYRIFTRLPKPLQTFAYETRFFLYRQFGRPVKYLESTKARGRREREGFFASFCQGAGLDIGYGGDLLVPNCKGWDMEHGNAQTLVGLKDAAFDFVYSSHTLEHMVDPVAALRNWWRVLKPGGHLLLYIPHRDLYEKKESLPSRWNDDHKHFFLLDRESPPDTRDIRKLIGEALSGFEIVYAKECSDGHTITDPDIHSDGEYSIEVVVKKVHA
jgi:SAM-dependent methyltransferase